MIKIDKNIDKCCAINGYADKCYAIKTDKTDLSIFIAKHLLRSIYLFLFIFPAFAAHSQTYDFGGAGGYEISHDFNHLWDASLSQELRFNQCFTNYFRFETTAEVYYNLWRKKAKVGVLYSFINKENSDDYYDNRHRFAVQLSYREAFTKWRVSWRGRVQSTLRDEDYGDYKINPKYYFRNKFQVNYLPMHSRFKPNLSCEFYCQLNNPDHNIIDKIRTTVGTDYILTRNSTLEIYLRYDKEIQVKNPANVFMLGAFYKYEF